MSVKNATIVIKVQKRPKSQKKKGPILKKRLSILLIANQRLTANC
jgi:hypothetical protein